MKFSGGPVLATIPTAQLFCCRSHLVFSIEVQLARYAIISLRHEPSRLLPLQPALQRLRRRRSGCTCLCRAIHASKEDQNRQFLLPTVGCCKPLLLIIHGCNAGESAASAKTGRANISKQVSEVGSCITRTNKSRVPTSSAAASARRAADAVDSAPSTGVLFMRFWVTSFADSGIWKILLAPSLPVHRAGQAFGL